MRRRIAIFLCGLARVIAVVLGLIAGLGVTVALVILVVTHHLKWTSGLLIGIIGLPLIEGVIGLLNSALGTGLLGIAYLLDRDAVDAIVGGEAAD